MRCSPVVFPPRFPWFSSRPFCSHSGRSDDMSLAEITGEMQNSGSPVMFSISPGLCLEALLEHHLLLGPLPNFPAFRAKDNSVGASLVPEQEVTGKEAPTSFRAGVKTATPTVHALRFEGHTTRSLIFLCLQNPKPGLVSLSQKLEWIPNGDAASTNHYDNLLLAFWGLFAHLLETLWSLVGDRKPDTHLTIPM